LAANQNTPTEPPRAEGHFAKKQLSSRMRLIAWSHRRRFEVGHQLLGDQRGRRVLDFGCGDATFLEQLVRSGNIPAVAVGAEIDPRVITDNRQRLGSVRPLEFIHQFDLERPEYDAGFDTIICMEVCEHLHRPKQTLDLFRRLLAPQGLLLVSVPVETGLPLMIKQSARRLAALRGIGDYPGSNPYSWGEFLRSVFAGSVQHIERPVHHHLDGTPFHDHKGFNWRVLRQFVAERFQITRVSASPLTWLPPALGSQVWITARKNS
jgi:SAM-dependent methyltransferase